MVISKRNIHIVVGPLLFVLCLFVLPSAYFTMFEMKAAIGTIAWMAYWWVSGPVELAITSLLPIVINALFMLTDMNVVIANYSSETILLLLGASIIGVSWEETGLDKRLAMCALSYIGNNLRRQLVFWFLLSAFISSLLPNSVVCSTITPIAFAMLTYVGEGNIAKSKIGSKLLVTIVFAVGIGGLATPLGGAMNLVTIDYIQQLTGSEFMYIDWIYYFMPLMLVLVLCNIVFLLRDVKKEETLGHSREYFISEYKHMPAMEKAEILSLLFFLLAMILVFTRQLYKDVLPGLKPAYIFIIFAMLTFLLTHKDGSRVMMWKNVKHKIVWQLLLLFGGGLAAGSLLNETGAAGAMGDIISNMDLGTGLLTVVVFILLPMLLSNFTSNTATAAIAVPIVISIAAGLGQNPIPYIFISTIGVNMAYIFPTSIRSIPVGYGLSTKYLFKEGWKISVMSLLLMSIIGYIFIKVGFFSN